MANRQEKNSQEAYTNATHKIGKISDTIAVLLILMVPAVITFLYAGDIEIQFSNTISAIITLTAPLYLPIIVGLGFDPLWFGLIFLLNLQMAYLTPPFGFNLFYLKSVISKDIKLTELYKAVVPFIGLQILALVLCIIFPQIITWLPTKLIA